MVKHNQVEIPISMEVSMKAGNTIKMVSYVGLTALSLGGVFRLFSMMHDHHLAGVAEKTGRNIDTTIRQAAEQLERATKIVESVAREEYAKSLGKSIDDGLAEAKASLNRITALVHNISRKI
jgi:hypothetical protein